MVVLLSAVILFLIGTLFHVVWWRVRLPSAQTQALLKIYAGVFLVWTVSWGLGRGWLWIDTLADFFQCGLLYASVMLAYIVTYSAIEAESPTLTVMMIVHNGPETGTPLHLIHSYVEGNPFLNARLKTLLASGALVVEDGMIKLGRPPSTPLQLVMHYRTLFGHLESVG
jgi:hypothetical protein